MSQAAREKRKRKKERQRQEQQQNRSVRAAAVGRQASAAFLPTRPPESPSPEQQGDERKRELLHSFDNFHQHRLALARIAEKAGEYAGLPCGIEGEQLIIEPSYPWAKVFNKPDPDNEGAVMVNKWFDRKNRVEVYLWREADGKLCWARLPGSHSLDMQIRTLGCSVAWGIEQEAAALQLLATLIPHHAFKHYLLTGCFIETSKRSGVRYLFRKLRPTVAFAAHGETLTILAALCMHPIGFYSESWSGTMCPTDDVISHLMLMRGDEAMYWRRANQIAPHYPNAGL